MEWIPTEDHTEIPSTCRAEGQQAPKDEWRTTAVILWCEDQVSLRWLPWAGSFTGRTKLTGQGRPGLRLAAWRAVWGALQTNTVYAARYCHLTTREHNRHTPTQAQIAAAILRHLPAVITTGTAWDPLIATHGTRRKGATTLAA